MNKIKAIAVSLTFFALVACCGGNMPANGSEEVKMFECICIIGKIITSFIRFIFGSGVTGGIVIGIAVYVCTRKWDEWKQKKNYSRLGVAIIESLREEVKTGLNIIKNKQQNHLPKKSWADGMNTIPNEVMLIILTDYKKIKQEESELKFKDIRIHCKNYFEHITENYFQHIAQHIANKCTCDCYQADTEKVKKMLEQTISLLKKNYKE